MSWTEELKRQERELNPFLKGNEEPRLFCCELHSECRAPGWSLPMRELNLPGGQGAAPLQRPRQPDRHRRPANTIAMMP
ncbi:hypothetical protein CLCR_07842 [Cladophialophora carrionii]|uniref:Uncharacterized protein n=1 Tax=Cladophialophora carrionii TaxID=86049 RepID=A0A1C1CNT4_9EURO|nr:hypothetical protein CLCR_07842 [Cladophialophora carrionii]